MRAILISCLISISYLLSSQTYDIYVSDAGKFNNPPWQILKFDQNGQNPFTFISTNLNWPQDILFLEDSNTVLISNLGSGRITRHNATTGVFINDFATGISGPTRTRIGPDSLLYVLQWQGNGKVRRYKLDGTYLGEFTSSGVTQSIGLDWDKHGNLYVSSYNGDLVQKFDTAGVDQGAFINSNLAGPTNIWFDTNGDLLVSDYDGTAVKGFDSTGVYINDFMPGLKNSEGAALLPNGHILIGNGGTRSVKEFDASGSYVQDLIPTSLGGLIAPNAVVIRNHQNVKLEEFKSLSTPVIYPSAGSEFYVDSLYVQQIESIIIYDHTGKMVTRIRDGHWSAEKYAPGAYVVMIYFKDGSKTAQDIVVIN